MADPNTQIDWWIAQAWQESQGGADNESLVAWLHENELTAISSYTILQAALSCSPEEAKEIVFGHPVWAGEQADPNLTNLDYTSDTLEPEPEPDPSFELDDWADQVEEDEPVYGEEGYQEKPAAGATPPTIEGQESAVLEEGMPPEAEPAVTYQAGFGETDAADPGVAAPGHPIELDPRPSPTGDGEAPPMDGMEPLAEPAPEPAQSFDLAAEPAPTAEIEPSPEPAPPFELEPQPAPAPPPLSKALPSTPAERAAVFAGAFGRKPAAARQGSATPDTRLSSSPRGGAPPSNDLGPAAIAETAPARYNPEHPQPAPAAVEAPAPLVYEPLPEIELPRPVTSAEPLFAPAPRAPEPAADDLDIAFEAEPAASGEAMQGEEPEARPEPATEEDDDGPTPDIDAAAEPGGIEARDGMADPRDEENGEPAAVGEEPALAALDGDKAAEDDHDYAALAGVMLEAGDTDNKAGDGENPPAPRKRVLLDPADDADRAGIQGGGSGGIPTGDSPEDLAEAARKLGVNFREADPSDIGLDPELTQVARQLGVSFREGGEAELIDDEIALEAQKLGISFRDGDSGSGKPEKPLAVKYLPLLLGVIIIVFLLLLGATFAGEAQELTPYEPPSERQYSRVFSTCSRSWRSSRHLRRG